MKLDRSRSVTIFPWSSFSVPSPLNRTMSMDVMSRFVSFLPITFNLVNLVVVSDELDINRLHQGLTVTSSFDRSELECLLVFVCVKILTVVVIGS